MIRVNVYIETDVLAELKKTALNSPKALRRELGKIARGDRANRLIRQLSTEPGKPDYPIRWKSAKQRRFVMAKLRREGNLPYRRTHKLSQGWRVVLESIGQFDDRGVLSVENDRPGARYVQGDDAQPFHVSRWPQATPLVRAASPGFESDIIEAWYKVAL